VNEREPWSELISVSLVIELRDEGMRRYGGILATKPPEDCVEGSLGAAWNAGLYREPEEARRGLCFAGHLLFYLARNHCFTEGNKRAAWASTLEVLARLGLTVRTTTDEAWEMINSVIEGRIGGADAVVVWLAERLEPLTVQ
jgi:death on curing protein